MPMTPTWLSLRASPTLCRSNWMASRDGPLIIIWLSMCQSLVNDCQRSTHPGWLTIHSPPVPGLARVSALEVLGVSFSDCLDFSEHFRVVCARASRSIYALKVLKAHGLLGANLWQVCRATTISYLTYAAPAWWGYTDACSRQRLQAVINRLRRFGLLPPNSLHMRNSVNTCVGSYSGRCFTISSTFCINSFPRRKRRLMRYARVPTTESSPSQTLIFFPLLPLSSLILHNSCMPLLWLFICILNYLFLCFLCYLLCICQTFNKEFTYLLTYSQKPYCEFRNWNKKPKNLNPVKFVIVKLIMTTLIGSMVWSWLNKESEWCINKSALTPGTYSMKIDRTSPTLCIP